MDKRLIRCLAYNASVAQLVEQLKKEVSCIETYSSDTDVPLVQIQPEAIYAESGQEGKSRAILLRLVLDAYSKCTRQALIRRFESGLSAQTIHLARRLQHFSYGF